jgi:hypothetical protein
MNALGGRKRKQEQAKQELGALSNWEMQAYPSREKPQPGPLRGYGKGQTSIKKQGFQWSRNI